MTRQTANKRSAITPTRPARTSLAALLLLAGCPAANTPPPAAGAAPELPAVTSASDPIGELAKLDPRKPVPLQPQMAWHQKQSMMERLEAMQRIAAGMVRNDWEVIATAAALIESSPQMGQMCEHMGAGADGFTEMALEFHRRADAIGEAARAHDQTAVLQATADTLQACTSCHATFRQEVVDAATWNARTGQSHVPSHEQAN